MKYLLDTNVLLVYLRDQRTKKVIEETYHPFSLPNIPIISVVTKGEIKSIGLRNNWGDRRLSVLEKFLDRLVVVDINAEDIIEKYAEIDAFSQGKLKGNPLGNSSRNMGKNDLWIAATAAVTKSRFLTMDADFDHLKGKYLDLHKVELQK